MVREIIQLGDKRLKKVSASIARTDISSVETTQLISDLKDTLLANSPGAAGLSAIQIGVPKRIFVTWEMFDESERYQEIIVFINPVIEILSNKADEKWEGCLSIKGLYGPVSRPYKIKVTYLDQVGDTKTLEAKGFYSHVIQHEYDHLEGKLFIEHIDNPENIWGSQELDEYLSSYGKYPDKNP